MPFENTAQPEYLVIHDSLRLRKYDGDYKRFLKPYQDPYIYRNSEGIFDDEKKPDLDYVRRMCDYLSRVGELYLIEARENGEFIAIGDVTVKEENPPIAIWYEKYRHCGIGTAVMKAVIQRARELGFPKIKGTQVFKWNTPSQKLHEGLGFVRCGEDEKDFYYELVLK